MAKSAGSNAEKLAELISSIEAAAYERGRADARKALLDRLTAGSGGGARRGPASVGRSTKTASPTKRTASTRAPRGSVSRFVERVLNEHPGATAPEIAGHAATDIERSVKLGSIRVELYKGGKRGRYVSDNGRWSLAIADRAGGEPGQAALPDPSPASDTASAESGDPAGPTGPGQGGEGDGKPLGLNF